MQDTTMAAPIALHDVAAAFEHVGVVVLVLDDDMQVVAAHGAVERCIGMKHIHGPVSVLEYMPPTAHDAWEAAHAAVVGGAPHAALDVERRDHAGFCHIAFDLTPMPSADPNQLHVMCVGRDVTGQRVAEQRDQQIMALAVHELRTPITALKGCAQLAFKRIEAGDDGTQVRRMLRLIDEQSARLVHMLDKWVDLVRIQQGKLRLVLGPVDLGALVEDVVRARQQDVSDRALNVVHAAHVTVVADRRRLQHALVLLLDNAIQYSPASSLGQIVVSRTSTTAHISVRDYGASIPPTQHHWVWEPWYQAPGETRRTLGGMGLRLFMVKHVVEQHGGSVWVEAGSDGGNVWNFSLPLAA